MEIYCVCCGNTKGEMFLKGLDSVYSENPTDIIRCYSCGNLISSPILSDSELQKIYSTTYLYPVHLLVLGEKKLRARGLAKKVRKLFSNNRDFNIMEIGCMFGYLIELLKEDYSVKGIDIGTDAVRYCKSKGLDVENMSAESFTQNDKGKYDVIIISHVLEHLSDPFEVLTKLKERLKEGGRVIILVPNSNSMQARLFGRFWGWWQVPVHVNHFNRSSLSALAKRSGYELRSVSYKGGDSLMILLNFINLFRFKNKNEGPAFLQKTVIRIFSIIFRFWYFLGNEEITVEFLPLSDNPHHTVS